MSIPDIHIYTQSLESLSKKDQDAIAAYENIMATKSRAELTPDQTEKLVEDTIKETGSKDALRRYDRKVGKLLQQRG